MNHGSLFSGIGGFDLAAEWIGWTNAFHCEWEEFPRKILQYHFPKSKSYGDINETDFTIWNGKIDILTGGFPCQPYSAAGKRLGKEDERHLWPQMLRAIREIEPRWIIGENVYGLVSWNDGMVFEEVQVDLENEGYEVQPYILPAAAVNAPHRRDRVWFVATNTRNYSDRLQTERGLGVDGQLLERRKWGKEANRLGDNSQDDNATNANLLRNNKCAEKSGMEGEQSKSSEQSRYRRAGQISGSYAQSDAANANGRGRNEGCQCEHNDIRKRQIREDERNDRNEVRSEFGSSCCNRHATNAYLQRGKECNISTKPSKQEFIGGKSYETNATNTQVTRSEGQRIEGQGQVQFNGRGVEVTRSQWDKFPTQPPVCGRDDGIPRELDSITFPKWRNESIKAYGNAIVPQVAYQLFKTIRAYEIQRDTRS